MIKIGKILVPTDFSSASLKALDYAVQFVDTLMGVEILIVHVLEPPSYVAAPVPGVVVPRSFYMTLEQACSKRLETILTEEIPDGIPARAILKEGKPWHEVVELAKTEGVDLIVIATHGHTGLKHFVLGSTAERVVRTAPCPVLTVRDPERDFVKEASV
jgi:nucleotide-binding universal stress UspA family protein